MANQQLIFAKVVGELKRCVLVYVSLLCCKLFLGISVLMS